MITLTEKAGVIVGAIRESPWVVLRCLEFMAPAVSFLTIQGMEYTLALFSATSTLINNG